MSRSSPTKNKVGLHRGIKHPHLLHYYRPETWDLGYPINASRIIPRAFLHSHLQCPTILDYLRKVLITKERILPHSSEGGGIGRMPERTPEEPTRKVFQIDHNAVSLIGYREDIPEAPFIESVLRRVPAKHLANLKNIIITYNQVFLNEGDESDVNAKYNPKSREITLGRIKRFWAPRDALTICESTDTLLHEIAHHYHFTNMPANFVKELEMAAMKENNTIGNIQYQDLNEYFED